MAYRGGRGGGGNIFAKAEPFVIFPDITLPDPKSISQDDKLLKSYHSFDTFCRNSPYHLGDGVSKKENESLDIERFSDSSKPKQKSNKSGSFYDYLNLRPDNFPKELLGDTRRERPLKRARWTQDADLQKLDVFEKLEAKLKAEGKEDNEEDEDKEDNEEDEGKEDNEEEEEEVDESESEGEDSGIDDYKQNEHFDDDDDDYNEVDDGDDGGVY